MAQVTTQVSKLKIYRPTKTQFESVTPEQYALYAVDPEFVGNSGLITDANGDIVERAKVTDTTSTSITLSNAVAGTDYHYGTLTSLTITANDTSDIETTIYFTAGSTINVSLPASIDYIGSEPVWLPNTKYAISILNNILVAGAVA